MSEPTETIQTGYQADTFFGRFEGERAVIKAVHHPGVPVLRDLEFWMLKREARVLRTLDPMPEVPDFLGQPDAYSIAIEFREGKTLREQDPAELSASFYEHLEDAVQRLHERGVVHSDLKKRENVMVSPAERPVLLDFGASFQEDPGLGPAGRFLYRQCYRMDLNAVSKLKSRFRPDLMTGRDYARLEDPVLLERLDRFRRRYIVDW